MSKIFFLSISHYYSTSIIRKWSFDFYWSSITKICFALFIIIVVYYLYIFLLIFIGMNKFFLFITTTTKHLLLLIILSRSFFFRFWNGEEKFQLYQVKMQLFFSPNLFFFFFFKDHRDASYGEIEKLREKKKFWMLLFLRLFRLNFVSLNSNIHTKFPLPTKKKQKCNALYTLTFFSFVCLYSFCVCVCVWGVITKKMMICNYIYFFANIIFFVFFLERKFPKTRREIKI